MEDTLRRYGIRNPQDLVAFGCGWACGRDHHSVLVQDYGEDEIYFGSVNVSLSEVEGDAISYVHGDWKPCKETLENVLSRVEGQGPKEDILVPAIPALDFRKIKTSKRADDWPRALRRPLVKVGKNMKNLSPGVGITKAYASGIRSAVLKVGQKWYRLKGCGNNDEGFVIKYEISRKTKKMTKQIRGSAWIHTAMRENYMTSHLANTLEKKGVLGANAAMGAYLYGPSNQPFGSEVSVPCCIVQETYGDRRLGTHVMSGLALLLPKLLKTESLNLVELMKSFPKTRLNLNSADDPVVSTAALMSDHMIAVELHANNLVPDGTHGVSFNVKRDDSLFAAGATIALPHRSLKRNDYPAQWTRNGSKSMGKRWRRKWNELVSEYNSLLPLAKGRSVLGYLYSRLGSDCGRIIREMHDLNVSWGTYQDEICISDDQWHCNAHANNVVVLSEKDTIGNMFLGYLDLDMAFDDETYVSLYGRGSPLGSVGVSAKTHEVLLRREHVNFLEVLAGADATSGVPMIAKEQVRKQSNTVKVVSSILHDGLVLAYLNEYEDKKEYPKAPFDPILHKISRLLIKLSIIVMADYVA